LLLNGICAREGKVSDLDFAPRGFLGQRLPSAGLKLSNIAAGAQIHHTDQYIGFPGIVLSSSSKRTIRKVIS
jgi:hypothetical protein